MTCLSFISSTTIFDSPVDVMPQEPRKRFFADAFTGEALRQLLPLT